MKKNILVVDDSALMRRVLCDIINEDTNFVAADVCRDGVEALEKLSANKYDGVLLDVNMPRMNGLELLDKLREKRIQTTIIMVSTDTTENADVTILAMEKGAVDFVTKPTNVVEAKGAAFRKNITEVLNAVIGSDRRDVKKFGSAAKRPSPTVSRVPRSAAAGRGSRLIALACSTGGPKALQSVIPFMDPNIDAPMVLVQHMPAGFTKSMAERLNEVSKIHVKEAEEGEILKRGWVYIAPGGWHLQIKRRSDGTHAVHLDDSPPIGALRPCADVMFESLKDSGYDEITCVVLTGMGADGTKGITSLAKSKPVHVIAQNAETCVVYGMPKAIAEAGMVDEVVTLTEVANTIKKNVGVH